MGNFVPGSWDATQGWNIGSFNSQDEFMGYGTAFINPDQFVLDMKQRVSLLAPTASPFLSWITALRKNNAHNIVFSWMEDELFTHRNIRAKLIRDTTNELYTLKIVKGGDWQAFEAAAAGDTYDADKPVINLEVSSIATPASSFRAVINGAALAGTQGTRSYTCADAAVVSLHSSIVVNDNSDASEDFGGETNELTEIGSDWTIGEWTAASTDVYVKVLTPNEQLQGYAQGSGLPNESRKRSRSYHNYTQIFKTPYSIANTLKAVSLYGGPELARLRMRKIIEHKVDIERAIIFQGGGVEGTAWGEIPVSGATNPLTRFKGLGVGKTTAATAGFIVSKNADLDSTFTFAPASADIEAINDLADAIFDDTVDMPSSTKVVFAGSKWRLALSKMAQNNASNVYNFGVRAQSGNRLGIVITELETPVGILRFVPMPLFRGAYEDYALVMDMANVEVRPLASRDTKLFANVGGKDVDGQLDYFMTECGLECRHESTHAILKLA